MKRDLYTELIRRIDIAMENHHYFESSWYCYAVIEDRLISLLRHSGGVEKNGKKIRMLGPKLRELKARAATDPLLAANFDHDAVDEWKERRNELQHAMADGEMSIVEVDKQAKGLATSGKKLVRELAAGAMRFKKLARRVAESQSETD